MLIPTISPDKTKLGWIGTGVMGQSMAGHSLGQRLSSYRLQPDEGQGQALIAKGAKWAQTPAQMKNSDVVFTIVGYPSDVREGLGRWCACREVRCDPR